MSLSSIKLGQFMRPEDLPKCLVIDLQPLKQIFLLENKTSHKPKQNQTQTDEIC